MRYFFKTPTKIILLVVALTCYFNGHSQNNSTSPISIHISVDKEYEITSHKNSHRTEINSENLFVKTDSVKQNHYSITIEIKNNSRKQIKIWLMRCSWEDNFIVNNDYIFLLRRACDSNYPILVDFKPGEAKVYKTMLTKSIKFDYPCSGCVYGPQVEETKLGLIVVDDIFKDKFSMGDYNVNMKDKSRWNIIWSNPLFLLRKK